MLLKNNFYIKILISILFSIIIYLLITKQIIYPTVIPMVNNGILNIFTDWMVILNANICSNLGEDVYLKNPCDPWNRKHVYGEILLYIPKIKELSYFYTKIFPFSVNFLFVFSLVSFFKYKKKIDYLLILFFTFSFSVILAIERANIDILIFLILIIISYYKNFFINQFFTILLTISKFYPIVTFIIYFFEKNKKKILFNLITFFLIIIIIFYFQKDAITKIFNNKEQISAIGGLYNFSFIGSLLYIKNLKIIVNNIDYNLFKILFLIIFIFIPIIFLFFKQYKYIQKKNFYENVTINSFELRFFILSSAVILFCYFFLFSNFAYREIFFLGILPFILKNREIHQDEKYFNFIIYSMTFKFTVTTLLTYINRSDIYINAEPLFTIFKFVLDFYLISIILVNFLIIFINLNFKTKN